MSANKLSENHLPERGGRNNKIKSLTDLSIISYRYSLGPCRIIGIIIVLNERAVGEIKMIN